MSERYGICPLCLGFGNLPGLGATDTEYVECSRCDGTGFDGDVFPKYSWEPRWVGHFNSNQVHKKKGDEDSPEGHSQKKVGSDKAFSLLTYVAEDLEKKYPRSK